MNKKLLPNCPECKEVIQKTNMIIRDDKIVDLCLNCHTDISQLIFDFQLSKGV